MGRQEYSEEELLAKKYNDLFKISKALGIKTARRLKTDKLIEAILKCQREEAAAAEVTLAQDAEAVVEALGGDTQEKEEEEEMLLDVQFPECGSQDSLDSISDTTKTSKDSEAPTGPGTSKSATPAKRHKRSGTYDVEDEEEEEEQVKAEKREQDQEAETRKQQEEEQEQEVKKKELEQGSEKRKQEEEEEEGKRGRKKRQRSSTFELSSSNDVTLPIDEKETEDNSKQLSQLLVSKVTVRGSRQHGTTAGKGKGEQKTTTRLSLTPAAKRRRESVTITPSAPAPALRPSRKSRGTPIGSPALTKATPTTTTSTAAVAPRPVFNIGRGDKVTEGDSLEDKQGSKGAASGIPRFLSYARRLKVPNFARIHKQAFQRMEGLDDYVDKRKARKDTLNSTTKKQQPKDKVFQPSVTSVKSLNFDFSAGSSEDCSINGTVDPDGVLPVAPSPPKPLSAVPLRPSPKSARRASTNITSNTRVPQRATRHSVKPGKPQVSFTKPSMTRKSPRVVSNASPKNTKEISPKATKKASPKAIPGQKASPKAIPAHKELPQTARKSQIGQVSRSSLRPVSSKKVSTVGLPVFGLQLKENQKPGKQSVSSPMVGKLARPSEVASPASVRKRMQDYSQSLASRGTGYVPYKGAVKPLKDRNDLKNLAQRKHKVKSSKEIRDGQRGILKGVRLNKRFELQMANRGIAL